ncbi:hypothetical protein CLOHYLEM_07756 [[Clostridium] hylemonae DSM 15053]|uniref:Uncharacterized protein n=1 Tax=[Clostridium] hylemonae DSM 15053 TaxID=553973 RepID=C0C6L7_9FIRM|nr:hypothetical protein CLOHYLEM_07756 [[Clostridium] hylemonae DSM 15053]
MYIKRRNYIYVSKFCRRKAGQRGVKKHRNKIEIDQRGIPL